VTSSPPSWAYNELIANRSSTFEEAILHNVRSLEAACEAKVLEFSAAVKAQVAAGGKGPNETVRRLLQELQELRANLSSEIRRLQSSAGISEAEIQAVEDTYEADRLPRGQEFWHRQVLQIRPTEDLDAQAESGLEALLGLVDPKWLHGQKGPYRLGHPYHTQPLHVVNSVHVGTTRPTQGPQRFARMLLVCRDHLRKVDNLDFFSAATFVPEVAILGNSLKEIKALGPEAERKLASLPFIPDDMVSATIYELLVGAACIRRGIDLQMLPENRAQKVPDYRIDGLGVPASIECKRRLGLTKYELDEAAGVEILYATIRGPLLGRGHHLSIEVCFQGAVSSVPAADFLREILDAAKSGERAKSIVTPWGSFVIRQLQHSGTLPGTRLYSPDFLRQVFGWDPAQSEWDGLVCEVNSTPSIVVDNFKLPLCIKWRSESPNALIKKARGVTSLWADGVRQIPDGEIGFIYIAYPEGARPAVADARTRHILDYMAGQAWHRWSVRIPASVITRLYARPVGPGCPDLIEASLPGAQKGEEFWLAHLPSMIYTRQLG
jgi:hypothetical protein